MTNSNKSNNSKDDYSIEGEIEKKNDKRAKDKLSNLKSGKNKINILSLTKINKKKFSISNINKFNKNLIRTNQIEIYLIIQIKIIIFY